MSTNIVYNSIGKTYDSTRKPDPELVAQLLQLLNVQINGHYLDVGCGSGNYTGALSAKGLNIEGIDISKEMLTKARQKHPTIQFLEADARQLPYKNDSFDGATCILATHHIGR